MLNAEGRRPSLDLASRNSKTRRGRFAACVLLLSSVFVVSPIIPVDLRSDVPILSQVLPQVEPIKANATCAQGGACVVGDTGPGGGKVFYVSATNFTSTGSDCNTACKYLEASPAPVGGDVQRTWATDNDPGALTGNQAATVPAPGATAQGIGSGMANTIAIKNQTGNVAATSAAVYAFDYENNSKTDWHLPSKNELNELCKYARTQTTGNTAVQCADTDTLRVGFWNAYYWSSSEIVPFVSLAWPQHFGSGIQGFADDRKFDPNKVRPVRAFG